MARLRNLRYFAKQRKLQKEVTKFGNMYRSLNTQASFPDSGYYYGQKQRELDRLYWKICPLSEKRGYIPKKGELRMKENKWQNLWRHLEAERDRDHQAYYEKVQVVDKNGRAWTAADMDAAMAYS